MNIILLGKPYLSKALADMGHNILHFHYANEAPYKLDHPVTADKLWQRLGDFRPDITVYMDDGNMPVLIDPENLPCPAIYYSIDTYCNPWHAAYAHGFDLTLVAQKDFLPIFTEDNPNAFWYPLFLPFHEPFEHDEDSRKRDVPIAFVGTLGHKNNPQRLPFLTEFKKLQPLIVRQGDYRDLFSRAKIVLNQTAFSELNFRCFEAMGLGAALLMEECGNGLTDIFTPGENILPPYPRGNAAVAALIARDYLRKPELLADIARNGYNLVLSRHSAQVRARALIEMAVELLKAAKSRKSLAEQRKPYVRASFGMLAAELDSANFAAYKKFFYKLSQENNA